MTLCRWSVIIAIVTDIWGLRRASERSLGTAAGRRVLE